MPAQSNRTKTAATTPVLFLSGAGLPAWIWDHVRRLYRDPTPARDLPAARAYLRGTADNEISPAVQRASAASLQATWTEHLPTGHLPMLQEPAQVSQGIHKLLAAINPHPTTPVP